jgi:hypothetical protein
LARTVSQINTPHFIDHWLEFKHWIGQEPVFSQNQVNVHLEKITTSVFHVYGCEETQDLFFVGSLRNVTKVNLNGYSPIWPKTFGVQNPCMIDHSTSQTV